MSHAAMRCFAVLVLLACTREPVPQSPHRSRAYNQLEARLPAAYQTLDRLRQSMRAAGDDCAQLAHALRTFAAAHARMLRELATLHDRLDAGERERFEYDHHDDRERFTELYALTRRCPDDPDVANAFALAGFSRTVIE